MEDKVHTALTLQEIKDQVAKKNGFINWLDVQRVWHDRVNHRPIVHEDYIDHAIEICTASLTSELKELKEQNARLKGTLGVEGVKQLLEAREENAELIKLLTEYLSVIQEYRKLTGKGTDVESALSKHQPIKKDEN